MNASGTTTMLGIHLRTGWKVVLAWVLALAATMVATTTSISGLYDTQAKIDSYARAVGSGNALIAINGRVYGLDTLGGVIANEFGFVASFALPLMGISLIARTTRRDEEAGRLEILLAGRIGRTAPLASALAITTAALLLTCIALAVGLVTIDVAISGAVVYAASLGALGLVFAGVAALTAQVVGHARGVYAVSLGVLVASYLLRGVGAVLDNATIWLSPLGWAQEARAFGDPRWWPVLLALGVAVLLIGTAAVVNGARDLGSALLRRGGAVAHASALLRSPGGFAMRLHRGSVVAWGTGGVVVAAAFGAVAEQANEAMAGNESLQEFLGGSGEGGGFLSMLVLLLGVLYGAYVIQAVGILRTEEATGRLESTLSGTLGRTAWLGLHALMALAGLVVVTLAGALALGLATAWSTGDSAEIGRLVGAVASYVPALLVLAGVALVLFAARPRVFTLAWLALAFTAVTELLGDALQLPEWLMNLSPMHHLGYPPQDAADGTALTVLVAVAVGLCAAAFVAFGRRGIPQG